MIRPPGYRCFVGRYLPTGRRVPGPLATIWRIQSRPKLIRAPLLHHLPDATLCVGLPFLFAAVVLSRFLKSVHDDIPDFDDYRRTLEDEAARHLADEAIHHPTRRELHMQMIYDILYTGEAFANLTEAEKQIILDDHAAKWDRGELM